MMLAASALKLGIESLLSPRGAAPKDEFEPDVRSPRKRALEQSFEEEIKSPVKQPPKKRLRVDVDPDLKANLQEALNNLNSPKAQKRDIYMMEDEVHEHVADEKEDYKTWSESLIEMIIAQGHEVGKVMNSDIRDWYNVPSNMGSHRSRGEQLAAAAMELTKPKVEKKVTNPVALKDPR